MHQPFITPDKDKTLFKIDQSGIDPWALANGHIQVESGAKPLRTPESHRA